MSKIKEFTKEKVEEMLRLLKDFKKYSGKEVFTDFVKIAAIIHQKSAITLLGADSNKLEEEEEKYRQIIKKYSKDEQNKLVMIYALFIEQLEENISNKRCDDVLGYIFTELSIANKEKDQFFTPEHLADFISQCTSFDAESPITVCDPCCGSGMLLLRFASLKLREGMNVGYNILFYGVDIDELCVMMTFVQLGYYGFSAIVDHGNTLTGEIYKRYYTLSYALYKCRFRDKLHVIPSNKPNNNKNPLEEEQQTLF